MDPTPDKQIILTIHDTPANVVPLVDAPRPENRPQVAPPDLPHRGAGDGAFALMRRNLTAAVTTALVQIPQDAIYALVALAPLGAQHAPRVLGSALIGTAVANVVLSLAGSRHLVGGPRASLMLLVAALTAALVEQPALRDAAGQPDVTRVLALVMLGVALAGALQIAAGAARLGTLVKYLPYPVRAGFMNGVAVLLIVGGLRSLLGLPAQGPAWSEPAALLAVLRPGALLVGLVTLVLMLRPPRWRRFVLPGPLIGMLAGMALHQILLPLLGAEHLGPTLDAPAGPLFDLSIVAAWPGLLADTALWPLIGLLLPFAFAVALMATLETLLVVSIIDGLARIRRDSNRELIAQGLSNLACAATGGQPSAAATARSLINYQAGGTSQLSIWCYAAIFVATVLWLPQALRWIPASALGGAFVAIGIGIVDDWSWRVPRQVLRDGTLDRAQRHTLIENYGVMLLVAGTSVARGLSEAVFVGVLAAMLLFVRSNSRALVRSEVRGDVRRSLKLRGLRASQWLQTGGRRIVLLELEGALFFGTADGLAHRVQSLAPDVGYVVLDLRRVKEIDSTGARILLEIARDLVAARKRLVIAELPPEDARTRTIRAMDVRHDEQHLHFEPDVDRALEWAEDRLLEAAGVVPQAGRPLTLAETTLGEGLDAEELQQLAAEMAEFHYPAGARVFRAGDAGDALYISTRGEIGILLPGAGGKRVASFAPGVIVGEMALLENRPRSADAVAEAELTLLMLSRAGLERLRAGHPALAAKLLFNLSRQLSARLRHMTEELAAVLGP